jgi:hypothetical protein
MCYTAEVSFATWGAGLLAALYLAGKGKPYLFPLVVSQMQLVEGLRWIHAVDERFLAILGKLVLFAQPVTAFYEAKRYEFILPYIAIQSLVELLYGSRDLRFVVAQDGHFAWKWNFDPASLEALPYWTGLFLGTYFILSREVGAVMLGLLAYFYAYHVQYGTYASLWCVWVNLLWIYYLLR